MNLIEIIGLIKPFIERLFKEGVKCSDLNYIDMLVEYRNLANEQNKKTWILEHLSEKHRLSTSQIKRIVNRFDKLV